MPNAKAPTTIRLVEPAKYLGGQKAESRNKEAPRFYDIEEQPAQYNASCMVGHSSGSEERQQTV